MSACSMRFVPWLVVGGLLVTVITLPVCDGLSLDQFLVFSLPASLFVIPILKLCGFHCELQNCLELPLGTPSLLSARAPPLLVRV